MGVVFTDIGFITADVLRLRAFYESIFAGQAEGDEWHSSLNTDGLYFVFLREKNTDFYYEFSDRSSNTILSFNVDDLDAEYERLLALDVKILGEPKTHPWGARSFQFEDPDGNILNFRNLPQSK